MLHNHSHTWQSCVMNLLTNSTVSTSITLKIRSFAPISIPLIPCLLCHDHPLPYSILLLILHDVTMPKHYEPSSYAELLAIPKFTECREIFLRAGWGPFLASLQGHRDGVSLKFSLGFYGRLACIGFVAFLVS
jgi:hypothetical protein